MVSRRKTLLETRFYKVSTNYEHFMYVVSRIRKKIIKKLRVNEKAMHHWKNLISISTKPETNLTILFRNHTKEYQIFFELRTEVPDLSNRKGRESSMVVPHSSYCYSSYVYSNILYLHTYGLNG